jgi:glutathione synthase/RimK-type ligase-like ATP-grasp enzyme
LFTERKKVLFKFDITLLTSSKFLSAEKDDWYISNILEDDRLLTEALEKRGLKVTRTHWDNPSFVWAETKFVIFRTPWDYFNRYDEFAGWLEKASAVTTFINPVEIIRWNIDKHYMLDLQNAGITVPPTIFIEPDDKRALAQITVDAGWDEFILKPAISGGAWHTYRLNKDNLAEHEEIFKELIKNKSMMLQEFQNNITVKGEISFMLFGGRFTHAVLKKANGGDFRVQDDWGGTVHDYSPSDDEISFAKQVVEKSTPGIAYARVDVMRDNRDELSLIELELFEPELWFRKHPPAAEIFADLIMNKFIK